MKKVKEYVYSKILKLDQVNSTNTQLSETTNTLGLTTTNSSTSGGQQNDTNNNNYKSTEINANNSYDKNNVGGGGDSTSGGTGGGGASKDTIANAQRIIELICSDQVNFVNFFLCKIFKF